MANVNVTYEDMRSAATKLQGGQQEIEGTLEQLRSLISELISGGFVTDKASKAFDTSYDDFNKGAREMIGGLTDMGEYLKKAADAMEQTDESLASALKG